MTEGMTAAEWAAVLASSPAPWGEMSTSKLVVTSPNYALARTAADPGLVMDYWNKVSRHEECTIVAKLYQDDGMYVDSKREWQWVQRL